MYIFTVSSRGLKFIFALINTLASLIIVFAYQSKTLVRGVLVIVIIESIYLGIVYGLYLIMLLHRNMFPLKANEMSTRNKTEVAEMKVLDFESTNEVVVCINPLRDEKVDKKENKNSSEPESCSTFQEE